MELVNLDPTTRDYMRAEAERDIAEGWLYISDRLTARGAGEWPGLLLDAIDGGDASTLAGELDRGGRLNTMEPYVRQGTTRWRRVPVTAAETLAEGEFNRFYVRGVCTRALMEGIDAVEVYRAKEVARPTAESTAKLGTLVAPALLLEDLRTHNHVDTALGIPRGPNSGISVRFSTAK